MTYAGTQIHMATNGLRMMALLDGLEMDSIIVYNAEDMQAFILDTLTTEPSAHVTIDLN